MSTQAPFRYPISSPTPLEVEALARAAIYLRRAANELDTARLGVNGFRCGSSPIDDFSAALSAAGCLCVAVLENAAER